MFAIPAIKYKENGAIRLKDVAFSFGSDQILLPGSNDILIPS